MLRAILFSTLFSSFLFATSNFTVRLAVFGNDIQLQKAIDKLPAALKDTVRTYKRGNLTYAHSIPTDDKKTLKKLLPAYQKVFKDAYIQPTKLK